MRERVGGDPASPGQAAEQSQGSGTPDESGIREKRNHYQGCPDSRGGKDVFYTRSSERGEETHPYHGESSPFRRQDPPIQVRPDLPGIAGFRRAGLLTGTDSFPGMASVMKLSGGSPLLIPHPHCEDGLASLRPWLRRFARSFVVGISGALHAA